MSEDGVGSAYADWKGWDRLFTFSPTDARYFEGECQGLAIAGAVVFEIGFGAGTFIAWAQRRGAKAIVGSEIDPVSLEAARARKIELLPAAFETVAAEHAARFDTVVAFDVFEHMSIDEIAVRIEALETMIKPGGHLLLRFPNAQSPFGLALQHGDPTHRTALSGDAFRYLTRHTDFELVRCAPGHHARGQAPGRRVLGALRHALRGAIGTFLNAVYSLDIYYDPVLVVVLRRS